MNSLKLNGINMVMYGLANANPFNYDAGTFTATWTLANPLKQDRLTLTLDTSAANAIRANAPGQAGNGAVLDGNWINPTALDNNASSRFNSGDGMPGGDFLFRFNFLVGDQNGNGAVTVADLNYVRAHQVGNTAGALYDPRADINGDGKIDAADIKLVSDRVGNLLPLVPLPPPINPIVEVVNEGIVAGLLPASGSSGSSLSIGGSHDSRTDSLASQILGQQSSTLRLRPEGEA
jgi:hypothetical protein